MRASTTQTSDAPANAVSRVGGVIVGVQPKQPVQQLIEMHLPVVRDLRNLAKLES